MGVDNVAPFANVDNHAHVVVLRLRQEETAGSSKKGGVLYGTPCPRAPKPQILHIEGDRTGRFVIASRVTALSSSFAIAAFSGDLTRRPAILGQLRRPVSH